MALGISVVICTYNGATLLPETLRHLALQRVRPAINWEIIIINNASTDNTREVAESEWKRYSSNVPFQVLEQPVPGLTYARELAFEKSKYDFVLFCDDDNWLEATYVNQAYEVMLQNPNIGALGGQGELVYEITPPEWFGSLSLFAHGPQSETTGKVRNNAVYGAGCIIRKPAFKKMIQAGFKSQLPDRKGNTLSAGGDYELCYAIALLGYSIWYAEELRFKHFMPAKRLSWDYCVRLIKEGPESFSVLVPYRIRLNLNSKKMALFPAMFLRTYLSYCKKMVVESAKKLMLNPNSNAAKFNTLTLISIKAKLLSFKNYKAMKENYRIVLNLEASGNYSEAVIGTVSKQNPELLLALQ